MNWKLSSLHEMTFLHEAVISRFHTSPGDFNYIFIRILQSIARHLALASELYWLNKKKKLSMNVFTQKAEIPAEKASEKIVLLLFKSREQKEIKLHDDVFSHCTANKQFSSVNFPFLIHFPLHSSAKAAKENKINFLLVLLR